MGSFEGHALPGSFFIVFAVWWTVHIFRRYLSSRAKRGATFTSSVTFPVHELCRCSGRRRRLAGWEWEGFVKVFFAVVGFIVEVTAATKHGRFAHVKNGQHATMFFFFGIVAASFSFILFVNLIHIEKEKQFPKRSTICVD